MHHIDRLAGHAMTVLTRAPLWSAGLLTFWTTAMSVKVVDFYAREIGEKKSGA
jgi:hypothetical protein